MVRAYWNDILIAESDEVVLIEGNAYFPPNAVRMEYLKPSDKTSYCAWKGTAVYYHLIVNGSINENAAWSYPDPKPPARQIAGYIAFWNGVRVIP